MKKIILTIMLLSTVWFTACGGESDKEAKELLQRVLTLVGIPQNIVMNICQDSNKNNLCDVNDLQTKISIKKGESVKSILEKVAIDENNQYFLEHYDPTVNILLELQNKKAFRYDDGNFTFHYRPKTQELSILQSMVDSGYLKQEDTADIKKANGVEDFYFVLLRDTYSNMNRLRAKGVENKDAVAFSLKEMADELVTAGLGDGLTDKLNSCGNDQACIDKVLKEVSSGMLIEQDEARDIATLKGTPFITKWKTDNSGVSVHNQISIPTVGEGYQYDIVWGDGTNSREIRGDVTHSYPKDGNYTVEIYGTFPQIYFGKEEATDNKKIVSIVQWGEIEWKSMKRAFFGCSNLKGESKDVPNLSKVTSLEAMFSGASLFNQDIKEWNVSTITSMKEMFSDATAFNQNLGDWDISNVTDMSGMFSGLTLSVENYNSLLVNWSSKSPQVGVTLNAGDSQYSSVAETERSELINNYAWNILDGGCDGSCDVYEPPVDNYSDQQPVADYNEPVGNYNEPVDNSEQIAKRD